MGAKTLFCLNVYRWLLKLHEYCEQNLFRMEQDFIQDCASGIIKGLTPDNYNNTDDKNY